MCKLIFPIETAIRNAMKKEENWRKLYSNLYKKQSINEDKSSICRKTKLKVESSSLGISRLCP
jgi:hypothetical protein